MTKTTLITGANRGIGLAIATELASHDMLVLLGSRKLDEGQKEAAKLGDNVIAVELDLSDGTKLKEQAKKILSEHGDIDVLINNAGVLQNGDSLSVDEEIFLQSLQVNAISAYQLIKEIAPGMINNGYGRIVNMSSGWGSFESGLTGPFAYSTSKALMNAITLTMSQDLPSDIKINSMCPGWVRTRMGGQAASRSPEEAAETAVWLATLPEDGPTGQFFRDKKQIEW